MITENITEAKNSGLYRTAGQILRNIMSLASGHFISSSEEVQHELECLYNTISEFDFIPENDRNRMMLEISANIIQSSSSKEDVYRLSAFFYNAFMAFIGRCQNAGVKTA